VRFVTLPLSSARSGVLTVAREGVATSAVIYCRISSDRTGEGLGVERQEEDCRALCERLGWEIGEVIVDNDISAFSGKRRPGYQRMLTDVESGLRDAIVAWHPDRLHRSPKELEEFIDLVEATGAVIATVQAGQYDLTTAAGRMSARIVGAVARHESEQKSERIRRAAKQSAEAGKLAGGGTRPFGFEKDRLTIREDEAELIREAADRIIAGETQHAIITDWAARGVRSPTGRTWKTTTFGRMLRSGRIAGIRDHHEAGVAKAVWPAIIDESTRTQVLAALSDPFRRKHVSRKDNYRYLLTGGIALCALCGAPLVARPKSGGKPCYVCATGVNFNGCGKIRQLAAPLEDLVSEAVLQALDSDELREALASVNADDADGELVRTVQQLETDLAELDHDFYVEKLLDRQAWKRVRNELEGRLQQAQRRLSGRARLVATLPSGDALREAWAANDGEWRRQVVAAALEGVVLGPAIKGQNFFNPDRVSLRWRA
jgi:DNA invertase Pin-like site-specific DNA recombinase